MDSPDRNHINAASQAFQIEAESPAFQNSPVFNYLSNLSPIKPVRNVHVGRGFLELNFPPPPNVFTSPRIGSRRELCSLKRTQYPDSSGAEKLALCYDDKCKALAAAPDGSRQSITKAAIGPEIQSREMIPCAGKECDDKGVQSQASSPSRYVDQYLADPVEESPGAVDSNDPCSNQATELPRALQGDSSSHTEVIAILVDVKKETETEMDAAPTSSEQLASIECVPAKAKLIGENSLVHVKPVNIEEAVGRAGVTKEKNGDRPTNEWPDLLSENINDQVGANPSPQTASGTQQDNHLVDQETVAFSSLMSEGEQDEVGDWKEGKPFCSSGLLNHGTQDVKLRLGEMGQQDEWDCTPQLLPESFENVQADDNPNEKSRVTSCETPECEMPFGCGEHSLYQRGMPRRCLHFEAAEARRKSMGSQCSSLIPANIVPEAGPPATCHHFETLNSTHIELNTNLSSKQVVNFSQQASSRLSICSYKTPEPHSDKVARSFHNNGNSPVTVPKPSGIGLHLNSIGNAVAMNCTTNMQLAERDYLSVHGEKSFSGGYQDFSEGSRSCSVSVGVVVNVSVKSTPNSASPLAVSVVESTEIDQQDSQCSGMGNSSASFCTFPLNVKPVASALPLNLSEKHLRPCEKKRMVSHDASGFGISPKKRRRKPPDSIDNEGCKRCNCKKSKCLKLYCECFAAGVYCVEPCSCQECFNKPEYEDTVLSTRQQIESRNPLAFAPRIVRRVTESPSNSVEDSNQTPASARHKRGCNCKKSMCLKKYCECYQAGVGCSDGCRCEGCKNIFGKKNGCREIIRMECREADDEEWEDLSEEKLDIVEIRSDILHPEQCHSGNLSPITPLFQCSSRGREIIPKSHLLQRRHLQSPDSEISNALSSCGRPPRSPRNSNTNSKRFSKGKEGSAGLVPFDKRQNCDKAERVDQFSPKWDGFADICSLTPLSNSPSRPAAASGTNDCNKILRSQLCHGSGTVSSSGSVHWRSSPVTPMPHFGGTKFVPEPDSNSGVHSLDDDTPEILKDNCSPIKPVKVSSPNQKRVSPPHNCLQELRRSSSSLGLRSGRKFILQSVPSFPPLTPYSEAKGSQK